MLQIYTNPVYTFLKAVLGRTDKDVIWLQKNTDVNVTEWKQWRRILCSSYRKILISVGNLVWKQRNYFTNSLLFDIISNPTICIQDAFHAWQCSWLRGVILNLGNTLDSKLFNSTNIFQRNSPNKRNSKSDRNFLRKDQDDLLHSACFRKWSCIYQLRTEAQTHLCWSWTPVKWFAIFII